MGKLADASHDAVGVASATDDLPQRIRLRRPKSSSKASSGDT
jgi:hypothetical protein